MWRGKGLLERRGEGGGVHRESKGRGPPTAEMQDIQDICKEVQKCTTMTHSAYTFVIMSEDSNATHLFGSIHCAFT